MSLKNNPKIDWTAIIMSLGACFILLTVGSDIWNLELLSIVVPLLFVYNLIPYIVRVYMGVVRHEK